MLTCSVMESRDAWFGVTYQEDKPLVQEAIKTCMRMGQYPDDLWELPLQKNEK
jgi:hypothetical protein